MSSCVPYTTTTDHATSAPCDGLDITCASPSLRRGTREAVRHDGTALRPPTAASLLRPATSERMVSLAGGPRG